MVRVSTSACKKEEKKEKGKEGASSLAPKVVRKGALKRKAERRDDHPLKKGTVTPCDK